MRFRNNITNIFIKRNKNDQVTKTEYVIQKLSNSDSIIRLNIFTTCFFFKAEAFLHIQNSTDKKILKK